ncbi:MAG: DUF1330 domain-containing protein, partial [Planctomycetota bacterium]
MTDDRFYAVRLLWVLDPERFAEYQERAKPILEKHGVHIERWLMTRDIDGHGFERPDEIVISWFRSEEAKSAFENDPEFVEVAKIRDEAAKLVTITGSSVFGDPP